MGIKVKIEKKLNNQKGGYPWGHFLFVMGVVIVINLMYSWKLNKSTESAIWLTESFVSVSWIMTYMLMVNVQKLNERIANLEGQLSKEKS